MAHTPDHYQDFVKLGSLYNPQTGEIHNFDPDDEGNPYLSGTLSRPQVNATLDLYEWINKNPEEAIEKLGEEQILQTNYLVHKIIAPNYKNWSNNNKGIDNYNIPREYYDENGDGSNFNQLLKRNIDSANTIESDPRIYSGVHSVRELIVDNKLGSQYNISYEDVVRKDGDEDKYISFAEGPYHKYDIKDGILNKVSSEERFPKQLIILKIDTATGQPEYVVDDKEEFDGLNVQDVLFTVPTKNRKNTLNKKSLNEKIEDPTLNPDFYIPMSDMEEVIGRRPVPPGQEATQNINKINEAGYLVYDLQTNMFMPVGKEQELQKYYDYQQNELEWRIKAEKEGFKLLNQKDLEEQYIERYGKDFVENLKTNPYINRNWIDNPISTIGYWLRNGIDFMDQGITMGLLNNAISEFDQLIGLQDDESINFDRMHLQNSQQGYSVVAVRKDGTIQKIDFKDMLPSHLHTTNKFGEGPANREVPGAVSYRVYWNGKETGMDEPFTTAQDAYDAVFDRMKDKYWDDSYRALTVKSVQNYELYQDQSYYFDALNLSHQILGTVAGFKGTGGLLSYSKGFSTLSPVQQSSIIFTSHGLLGYNDSETWANTPLSQLAINTVLDATVGAMLPYLGGSKNIRGLGVNFTPQGPVLTNPNTANAVWQLLKGSLAVGTTFEASVFIEEWMKEYSKGVADEDGIRDVPWSELSESFWETAERYSTDEGIKSVITNLGIATLLHSSSNIKRFLPGGKAEAQYLKRTIPSLNEKIISNFNKRVKIPKWLEKEMNRTDLNSDQKLMLYSRLKMVEGNSLYNEFAELEWYKEQLESMLGKKYNKKTGKWEFAVNNDKLQAELKFINDVYTMYFNYLNQTVKYTEKDFRNIQEFNKTFKVNEQGQAEIVIELKMPDGNVINIANFIVLKNGVIDTKATLKNLIGVHPFKNPQTGEQYHKLQDFFRNHIAKKISDLAKWDGTYDLTQKYTEPKPRKNAKGETIQIATVNKGETLNEIANMYQVSANDLVTWNGIKNPNHLRVGQELVLQNPEGFAEVIGDVPTQNTLLHNLNSTLTHTNNIKVEFIGEKYAFGTLEEFQKIPNYNDVSDLVEPVNLSKQKKRELGYDENAEIYTIEVAGQTEGSGVEGIKTTVSSNTSPTVYLEEITESVYRQLGQIGETQLLANINKLTNKLENLIEEAGMPSKEVKIELFSSLFEDWVLNQSPNLIDNYITQEAIQNPEFDAILNQHRAEIDVVMNKFWNVMSQNSNGIPADQMLKNLVFALQDGMFEQVVPTDITVVSLRELLSNPSTFKLQVSDYNKNNNFESDLVRQEGKIIDKLELSNESKKELFPENYSATLPSTEKPSNKGHKVELIEVDQQGLEDWETLVLNSWRPPEGLPNNLSPVEWRGVVLKNIFSNNYVDKVLSPKAENLNTLIVPKTLQDIDNKLFNLLNIVENPISIANSVKQAEVMKVKEMIIRDWNNGKVFKPTDLTKLSTSQIDKKAQDLLLFAKSLFRDPKLDIEQGEWWDSGVQFLRDNLTDEMPQLAKEDNWALFKLVSGITSQQRKLDPNLSLASYVIGEYFETGELTHLKPYLRPRKIMHTVKGKKKKVWKGKWVDGGKPMEVSLSLPVIEQQFQKLTLLKEKFGSWESVNNFLIQPTTVKDFRNFLVKEFDMSLPSARSWAKNLEGLTTNLVNDDITYPAMMFGPKIGAMIGVQNNLDLSVNDLWMARFAQIGFGELTKDEVISANLNKIIDKAMVKTANDLGISVRGVQAITWVAMKDLFGLYGGERTTDDYITAIKRRKQRYEDFITTRPFEGVDEARIAKAFRKYDIGDKTYREEFARGDISFKLKKSRLKNKIIEVADIIEQQFPNGIKSQSLINVLTQKHQVSPDQIRWLGLQDWIKTLPYKPSEKIPMYLIKDKLNEDPINIRHITRTETPSLSKPNIKQHSVWSESEINTRNWELADRNIKEKDIRFRQEYLYFVENFMDIAKHKEVQEYFKEIYSFTDGNPDFFKNPNEFRDKYLQQYHNNPWMMQEILELLPENNKYYIKYKEMMDESIGPEAERIVYFQSQMSELQDFSWDINFRNANMPVNELEGKKLITKDYRVRTKLAKNLVEYLPNHFIADGPFISVLGGKPGLYGNGEIDISIRKNLRLVNNLNSLFNLPWNYTDPNTQVSASQIRLITNRRLELQNTPKNIWSEIGKRFYGETDYRNLYQTWHSIDPTEPLIDNLLDRMDKISIRQVVENDFNFYLNPETGIYQSTYGVFSDKSLYTKAIPNWMSKESHISMEKATIDLYNTIFEEHYIWSSTDYNPGMDYTLNKEGFHSKSYGNSLDNFKPKFASWKGGFGNMEGAKDYHEIEVLTPRNSGLIDNISQIPTAVLNEYMAETNITNKADIAVDDLIEFANFSLRGPFEGGPTATLEQLRHSTTGEYTEGHFDEPNVIGHIRGTYIEPKVWNNSIKNYETLPFKFGMIGEVQGDWSQKYNQMETDKKPPFPGITYLKPLIKNYISEAVKNGANGIILNGGLQAYTDWYGALDGMNHKFRLPPTFRWKKVDKQTPYTFEPVTTNAKRVETSFAPTGDITLDISLQAESGQLINLNATVKPNSSAKTKLQYEFYTKLAGRMAQSKPPVDISEAFIIIKDYVNKKLLADPSYDILVYERTMHQHNNKIDLIIPKEFVSLIIQNKTLEDFNHSYNNRIKMSSKHYNEINVRTSSIKDLTPDGLQQPFLLKHYDESLVNSVSKILKPFGIRPQIYWLDYLPENMSLQKFAKLWEFTHPARHPMFKNFDKLDIYSGTTKVPFIGYSFIKGEGKKDFKKFIQEQNFNSFKLKKPRLTDKEKSEIYNENISPPSKFEQIKLRVKATKDRAKNNFSSKEEFVKTVNRTYRPVSSVLKGIGNPVFKRIVRKQVTDAMLTKGQWNSEAEPFLMDLIKLEKTNYKEYENLSLALFNGDIEMVENIFERNGFDIANYSAIVSLTDNVFESAISYGTDIHKLDNYFPRRVRNVKKLWDHIGQDKSSEYEAVKRQKEKELGKTLSEAEEASLLESFLRGFVPKGNRKPGYTKSRNVELLTRDMLPFYDKPQDALLNYIDSFAEYLSVAKIYGPGSVDESIGKWVDEQFKLGNIKGEHIDKAKNIISEHYASADVAGWVAPVKNSIYTVTMGSFTSAIRQLGDQTWAVQENGLLKTLKYDIKALLNSNKIKLSELSVDNIMYELQSKTLTGTIVNDVFRLAGIKLIDGIGKESLVNGVYEKYVELANKGKYEGFLAEFKTDKDLRRLDYYFSAEEKVQLFEDLRSGEITPLIQELALNVLLDWQPVAKSEVPSNYKKHPLWYQLKTYTIKQINSFKDNAIDDIALYSRKYNNAKTKEDKEKYRELLEQSIVNLMKLVGVFMATNAGADVAIDYTMGRDIDLSDLVVQQIFKLLGASRYMQFQAENEGLPMAMFKQVAPASIGVGNDFYRDVVGKPITKYTPENKIGLLPRYLDNKRYNTLKNKTNLTKEETKELERLEHKLKIPWYYQSLSLKFVPLLGKPLYWHKGLGHQKTIQRRMWKYRSDSEELDLQPNEIEDYINTAQYALNANYITEKQYNKQVSYAVGYEKYRKIMSSGEWDSDDLSYYQKSLKMLKDYNAISSELYWRRYEGIDKFYEEKYTK